ncbi:transposase [Mycobacterium intracellulare MOTT-02]|uniref:Transposase n=2 Tax=Mycobacterium TaxID=1763 RepID=A0A1X1ZK54_9MYCO|nr:transposase [Mycobacterium intracellulare ATCC 13950]AFC47820.1 transposase [Mycobacterium intracellulare MOTT-02]ETZ37989.1 istB-like ATP binding family protein [Mycobacterium intracellulare MIN_061107_1834]KLO45875.1 transposase [Mycobacterium nebraskense]MBZ4508073.1 transposase [Mycobacterium avium subsp. hominissuis]OBG04949.1 transposase [Mycobacterium intracellulare]BCP36090.1 hypothetical protein MINTMi198_14600 [Mycobacterium intracellulare M.i.198]
MEDWALIRHLHRSEGLSQRAIARQLGIARDTVAAAVASHGPPKYEQDSRPANRWGTSTSIINPHSTGTWSLIWVQGRSWARPATWCCSARRALARPTSRSGWRSRPHRPGTESRSPPRWTGSPGSKAAHNAGRLPAELAKLRRIGLLVVDEVGYIPFEQDAANLFFQLVSRRFEHASLILTSNLPFARWGDVFGDQVVAAAMIDRIVHHADVLTLKSSSCRLKDTGIDTLPSARADNTAQ